MDQTWSDNEFWRFKSQLAQYDKFWSGTKKLQKSGKYISKLSKNLIQYIRNIFKVLETLSILKFYFDVAHPVGYQRALVLGIYLLESNLMNFGEGDGKKKKIQRRIIEIKTEMQSVLFCYPVLFCPTANHWNGLVWAKSNHRNNSLMT